MIAVEYKDLRMEWVPEDGADPPDDTLMRFHTLTQTDDLESWPSGWEPLDNGSYCTQITDEVTPEALAKVSVLMLGRLADAKRDGWFKREAEWISWTDGVFIPDPYPR